MKSIDINMTSVEVKSETISLKATWTPEMAKEISSLTDLDMSSFESYVAKEIRREGRKKSINKIFKK